jgi:hypothetical protein
MDPVVVRTSEAAVDEKDERWDEFPEGTGDTGRVVRSADCVAYISCV